MALCESRMLCPAFGVMSPEVVSSLLKLSESDLPPQPLFVLGEKCHNFLRIAAELFCIRNDSLSLLCRGSCRHPFFRPKSPNLILSAFLDALPPSNDQINREVEI